MTLPHNRKGTRMNENGNNGTRGNSTRVGSISVTTFANNRTGRNGPFVAHTVSISKVFTDAQGQPEYRNLYLDANEACALLALIPGAIAEISDLRATQNQANRANANGLLQEQNTQDSASTTHTI